MSDKSKTAERSMPKAKKGAFETSPECPRLIPLANGNVYLRNPVNGKTEYLKAGTIVARIAEFDDTWRSRLFDELETLNVLADGELMTALEEVVEARKAA